METGHWILRARRATFVRFLVAVVTWTVLLAASLDAGSSLRFHGHGTGDIDRVKVRIDSPAVPADIGSTDFTVEFWLRAFAGSNAAPDCAEGADNWITGNTVIDRDVYGPGDWGDYGVSLRGGRIAFGVDAEEGAAGICGSSDLRDGTWHHVALTWRKNDGEMQIWVDGALERTFDGPGDSRFAGLSYRDGRSTAFPASDPFLVFGAEKHDAGSAYPSFEGWLDEMRLSTVRRYTAPFTPPSSPFLPDAQTAGLWHFDEGQGDLVEDSAPGGFSNGQRRFGGSVPAGPEWSTETPFPDPRGPLAFYSVVPCRQVDTRAGAPTPDGVLVSGVTQPFTLTGAPCGVPADAISVSLNVTVTLPSAAGSVRLFAADASPGIPAVIAFAAGQTRANNQVLGVARDGSGRLDAEASIEGNGTVHLILDVNGYFALVPDEP